MLIQRSRTYYRSTAKAYSTRSLSQSYRFSLLVEFVARSKQDHNHSQSGFRYITYRQLRYQVLQHRLRFESDSTCSGQQ